MRFVLKTDGRTCELELRSCRPEATVGDLMEALPDPAARSAGGLLFGTRYFGREQPLSSVTLLEGVVVRPAVSRACPAVDDKAVATVRVATGLDAGVAHPLDGRVLEVGRDPGCDVYVNHPSVSRRHCRLVPAAAGAVVLEDAGSTNGTWVDGVRVTRPTSLPGDALSVIEVGDLHLILAPTAVDDRHQGVVGPRGAGPGASTVPFNRPPRRILPADGHPLNPPVAPRDSSSRAPLSVAAIVAPLILAGVMWRLSGGNPTYILFSLLSPVMGIATWYETRRRGRRAAQRSSRAYRQELDAFRTELEARRHAEAARRHKAFPDLARVIRTVELPSVHLWERRTGDPDFMQLAAGIGEVHWRPPLSDRPVGGDLAPEVAESVAAAGVLPAVPVPIDLTGAHVVGVVGDRQAALAVARSLVAQAACHQGPADLAVAAVCGPTAASSWDWAKWLPHTRAGGRALVSRLLAANPDQVDAVAGSLGSLGLARPPQPGTLAPPEAGGRTLLAVVDGLDLSEPGNAGVRDMLRGTAGRTAAIVVAPSEELLPASCTAVMAVEATGRADLRVLRDGLSVDGFAVAGLSERNARRLAVAMARYEDPERQEGAAALPDAVGLLPLLDIHECTVEEIQHLWGTSGQDPGAATPIGVGEAGPFVLDLVRHGPHGLVGGTTGSGKSEFLRSLVAGLAARTDPDHLTFILVDFKGGSAFDECSRLPHTVGMLSDLDGQLVDRALTCLMAELAYRERVLREAGATDLPAYLALTPGASPLEPLPRLVVVIDEFATLAHEYPDQMETLVAVAQRGRSMGVHLILATQKPSSCVNDNIRTNSRLRVALRFEDAADSMDVIDTKEAINIVQPGRAYVRLRAGVTAPVQTARVTGVSDGSGPALELIPFQFGPGGSGNDPRPEAAAEGRATDLARLIDAITAAHAGAGGRPPRRPWPEPLPGELPLDSVWGAGPDGSRVLFALADDPPRQAQEPVGWDLDRGNLLLVGVVGSGTTTALSSVALAAASQRAPEMLHLYVLDFGAGELSPLSGLPHTGAFVGAGEQERQLRLVDLLFGELARRKPLGPRARSEPRVIVLVDNFDGLAEALQAGAGIPFERFKRVYAEGPEVGIHVAASAFRLGALPSALVALTQQKLAFRLADVQDYSTFGLRPRQVPTFVPGRAVASESARVVQVGRPANGVADAVAQLASAHPAPVRPPAAVGVLPDLVPAAQVARAARLADDPLFLPLGIGDRELSVVGLEFQEGDGALVAGPGRSGKTSTLAAIAEVVHRAGQQVATVGVAFGRSPLAARSGLDTVARNPAELQALAQAVMADPRRQLVLVDDAERVDDPEGALAGLLAAGRPDVHVVVAAAPDALRRLYGHWTVPVRRSQLGVLLRPEVDLDGDMLSVRLPRQLRVGMRPGRGFLVRGTDVELIQVAAPGLDSSEPHSQGRR